MAEELDTSVSTLLGETIQEEGLNEKDLKNISEKLEVINLQFAKRNKRKIKTIRYLLIFLCIIIVAVFITLIAMNSEYLSWDFNNSESAIAGTLLHGFEFLFVRFAPFVFIVSVIGIVLTYRKQ
ncbi:transcriptional regulator [Amedibacillus dolichus]|uniref:transcriptional regulator n=1 Tax=Amedibacillus dolichus TaxID=31971 RepID=UPI00241F714D|nr:transcriptional regulator [Amedibacillus dolichus]